MTLLAALAYSRQREITDTLVELLISTVHRIKARAQKRVEQAFLREIRRVTGKENILLKMTEAALESPDETVHEVIIPRRGRCGGAAAAAARVQGRRHHLPATAQAD